MTCLDLMELKDNALDKIMKAELILTEITERYGQAEDQNIFTTRNILYNELCNGVSPQGTEKQICDWALDYDQINRKLEIISDYIIACRMLLENCAEDQIPDNS